MRISWTLMVGIRRIPNMYSFTKSVKSTYTCCCSEGDALLRTGQLGWKLGLSVKIKERFHPKLKMSLSFNLMLFISGKSPLTVILVKQKKVSCTGFKWLEGEKISYFWVLSFFYCCMFMVCSFIYIILFCFYLVKCYLNLYLIYYLINYFITFILLYILVYNIYIIFFSCIVIFYLISFDILLFYFI